MSHLTKIPQTLIQNARNLVRNLTDSDTLPAEQDQRDAFVKTSARIPEKDWTVLIYAEGTDRLAYSTNAALNKMEQVGSTPRAHVVMQSTVEPTWRELSLPNLSSVPTRRYYVSPDQNADQITSPVVEQFPGKVNLTADSLQDFISWGMKNFPAKHTMLIIKKHGAGFAGVSRSKRNGEVVTPVPLSARELSQALQGAQKDTGKKLDVLSFDSCSMQQMEVAFQVRNQVGAVTGSQEDVFAIDFPYARTLAGINQLPAQAGGEEAAFKLVETYSQTVERGMQSAVRTAALPAVAGAVADFVAQVEEHGVAPSLLYTTMQSAPSMEPGQTSAMAYNFRDLGRFLEGVVADERYPEAVRQSAARAQEEYSSCIIARYASADKQVINKPTGLTCFLPWKGMPAGLKESYQQLDWAKDSGWGRLLDYALEAPCQPSSPKRPEGEDLSLGQRLGKWGLKQYKQYISPYLTTSCAYTPSCSQFAREALQSYGLREGSKLGFLRFISCDGHVHGHDPVHKGDEPQHVESQPLPLIAPPQVQADSARSAKHNRLARMAGVAGRAAGAVLGATLAAPAGAAIGAVMGWRSGRGSHSRRQEQLEERYSASIAHGYANLAQGLAPIEKVTSHMGQGPVAGLAGSALGVAGGALGGASQGWRWGRKFGQLWSENRVKDAFHELPQNPANQAILDRDYGGKKK